MKSIALTSILFYLFAIQQNENPSFTLIGETNEIANGTQLFIKNTITGEALDSVVITDNIFTFKTKLGTSPIKLLLYTKDLKHYKFI